MAEDPTDIIYSPFAAAMTDRTPEQRDLFAERFSVLPDDIREFLTSIQTVEALKNVMESTDIAGDYDLAVSKIVSFVALGDVAPAAIDGLLVKLGLSQQQATDLSQKLLVVLRPVIAARSIRAVPSMPELPPLTTEIPPAPAAGTQAPPRNIIDLRKQQPEQ